MNARSGSPGLVKNVPLLDVNRGNAPLRDEIIEALTRVVDSGRFLFGPDVQQLEKSLAERCEVEHAIACASGSDALLLALMALDIGDYDEVIVPSFTFFATASAVTRLGATPVFVDIEPATFNMDPACVKAAITPRTKAIIPVHLFGQCADMTSIMAIARAHNVPVIEDAAQAIDARHGGKPACSFGDISCLSFYPTKNLGGMGDGGMLTTNNALLAERLRLFAAHGMNPRYHHRVVGINSRLDTLQAAVLNVKLKKLAEWSAARTANAHRYDEGLTASGLHHSLGLPLALTGNDHVWNQYTIRVPHGQRNAVKQRLAEAGVGSEVYYPIPLHLQECFRTLGHRPGSLPETERAAEEVLSLPIFPELTATEQDTVIERLSEALAPRRAMAAEEPTPVSLLFKILFASAARSTHHKIALDALRHLRLPDAQSWMDVFLRYHGSYLEGAKAPDTEFKDFKNHVLHVHDGYWGGAITAAQKWYDRSLKAFKSGDFEDGVYSAGVLSHYFSDPLMPLHTQQSEDEGPVHRAVEWSVCKSYGELQHILDEDQGGYPRWECPAGDDWLAQMVRKAADLANPHYDTVIDHYNLEAGVRDPLLGLDQTLKDVFAKCLGYAVVGFARILERLIEESRAFPPFVEVTLQGVLAVAKLPFRAVARHTENVRELESLRLIYDEFERTGKVIDSLSPDDAAVRKAHADEVLKVPLSQLDDQPIRKPGQRHGQGVAQRDRSHRSVLAPVIDNRKRNIAVPQPEPAKPEPKLDRPTLQPVKREAAQAARPPKPEPAKERILRPHDVATEIEEPAAPVAPVAKQAPVKPKEKPAAPEPKLKFHLDRSRPIQDAPSIGSKTAERMKAAGIKTVGELLAAHPEKLAAKLDAGHIVPDVIRQWQAEATMCCRVPGLRGHDAQILVACGIDQAAELAEIEADELLELIQPFVDSPDGQRVLRGSPPPDEAELAAWIAAAQQARSLKAA